MESLDILNKRAKKLEEAKDIVIDTYTWSPR